MVCRLKQPLIWKSYCAALREPKVEAAVPQSPKIQNAVTAQLKKYGLDIIDFKIDLNTPKYVKLDRSLLRGLFGKFNPSRGDLVFSRTGELLGIMVNSTYCLMIHNFAAAATLQFGPDVRGEHTGSTLSQFYFNVFNMPLRLQ